MSIYNAMSNGSGIVRSYTGAGKQAPWQRKLKKLCYHMVMHEISEVQNWKNQVDYS